MTVIAEKMALAASLAQGSFDHAEAVAELAQRRIPLVVYENDQALDANLAEQPDS